MIIGHPGSWQQFQLRLDNKNLSVMEMKSKYLHEQYLFEAQILNLQQIQQQNAFMNGVGGGGSSSEPTPPSLETGARIRFEATSILNINTDLGWDIENIEDWGTNVFNVTSGALTYLTVTQTDSNVFEVIIGGILGLEVNIRDNAFLNSTTILSFASPTDIIFGSSDIVIEQIGLNSFKNSNIVSFQNDYAVTIAEFAFESCALLNDISLSNTSQELTIANSAFQSCTSLNDIQFSHPSINIPGSTVFEGCTSLATINSFSSKIVNLGASVFSNCTSLTSVVIGDSGGGGTFTGAISDYTFSGCTSLEIFTLNNNDSSVTSFGNQVLEGCTSLTNITFLNLVTLGNNIFLNVADNGNASFKTDQDNSTYDPNGNIIYLVNDKNWIIDYT